MEISEKHSCKLASKIDRQRLSDKKTARERIELLVDQGSLLETDYLVTSPIIEKKFITDGVITGFATVNGEKIALYSQDFTLKGGSLGIHHAKKICKIMDLASKIGCPIIGIIDSGGARIDEGIHALSGYGEIFMRNTRLSGIIPQISIILGPCAGGAVYSPALTDFIFTTEKISQLFITGPHVIKQVLHQEISKEELGGTNVHAKKSGVVHFVSPTEKACFTQVKKLLSFIPNNYLAEPPTQQDLDLFIPARTKDSPKTCVNKYIATIIPKSQQKSYDIRTVISELVDEKDFLEIQKDFAKNIVLGFARIEKNVVGIVANQPQVLAGAIDIDASCKAARFINFCDSFSIPIISLVDVPGFLPGVEQEHNGIIRHGAKLLAAYANATIPKITIILRKAFGGAYIVMGSKHLGADFVFAWPNSQIAILGPQAAVAILHRKRLQSIENRNEKHALTKKLEDDYAQRHLTPSVAAEYGYIDGVIIPEETRQRLAQALAITNEKVEKLPQKKRHNLPV
jgi:acetyl-CoA carboxylase carboxyltransferase component